MVIPLRPAFIIEIRRGVGYITDGFTTTTRRTARRISIRIIIICTQGQLTAFNGRIDTTACSPITHITAEGGGIAFDSLIVCDNVQNTAHALCIILWTRISDHLYLLDAVGGHTLQHFLGIVRHHLIGLVVHIDLKRTGTIHLDVVLAIHRYHRHLSKHFQNGVRLRIRITLYVVGNLVDIRLHERLLLHDFHTL